ncbi:TPA: hypothetical protein DDW35_05660 [Candidatus Sumerlaeota bacterium]|jgi:hypothetical protein|nr:hypothetical protein [Candidatus Sumerlaeota bacterium]
MTYQNKNESKHKITDDVIREAKATPSGWVYKIEGDFGPTDHVPPEAIVGAWRVDEKGKVTGEFVENPKYRPRKS